MNLKWVCHLYSVAVISLKENSYFILCGLLTALLLFKFKLNYAKENGVYANNYSALFSLKCFLQKFVFFPAFHKRLGNKRISEL